jgi:hypothetical protein
MSTETKQRVLMYRRAKFLTHETRNLQQVIEAALKACPKTGQRVLTAATSDGDDIKRVLNEHRKVGHALCGVLYRYTPGQHQVVVAANSSAAEWPVEQVLPPTLSGAQKAEFVEGLLYFLVFENHVIVSQSAAFRIGQMEDYMSRFLRDIAKVANQNEMVLLMDVPSESLRKTGISNVRAVRFDVPMSQSVPVPKPSGAKSSKEVFAKVLNTRKFPVVEKILQAFGMELPTAGLTEEDAEDVEMRVELRVAGRQPEDANALLDQVGNLFANTVDRDYEVELKDGTKLKGSDLVVKKSASVDAEGGVPKTSSVWKEMARYLMELQESKRVIA